MYKIQLKNKFRSNKMKSNKIFDNFDRFQDEINIIKIRIINKIT